MSDNTKTKKTWKNYYWYYYKWHIFFIIFFGIAIAVCTAQCAMKVNPDCYVLYYSNTYISDNILEEYTSKLEKYVDDVNEDGKKKITVINCTYLKNDANMLSKSNQVAVMQMQSTDTCVWILDEKGKDMYYNQDNIDIFATYDKFDSDNGHSLNLSKYSEFSKLTKDTSEDLYLFARKGSDGKIVKQAKNIVDGIAK